MPVLDTKNLGQISWERESEIEFPCGLPGFEEERRFVVVRLVHADPLLFLQSLSDGGLCFVALPVRVADPQYALVMNTEDLETIEFRAARQPRIGDDVHCLAVVSFRDSATTANLLAPVVINLQNMKAVQAISQVPGYSHQHLLVANQEAAVC